MSDFALVVGIESYASAFAASLQGPSLDALRFTLWLRKLGVSGKNIILIHNKSKEWSGDLEAVYQKTLQRVREEGVIPSEEASFGAIKNSWREGLLAGPAKTGTLWIYWSGHGVTFPKREEALLCGDVESGEPTYLYLSELRDSLRSEKFARFSRQRIIIDACAEHLKYEDLQIAGARSPDSFEAVNEPDQIVLNAVPVGKKARAEEGGSLFTRMLLRRLETSGWPDDIVGFYQDLMSDIAKELPDTGKVPRLRILSPKFEAGILAAGDRREVECRRILRVLADSKLPYNRYQPFYARTMGPLSSDPEVLAVSSVTDMLWELLELPPQAELGGFSRALVELLSRVTRAFPDETGPIKTWLNDQIPEAGQLDIQATLDREDADLALVFLLMESALHQSGVPVAMSAYLCDATFSVTIQTWNIPAINARPGLEEELRRVLCAAGSFAQKQRVKLAVHVFANPPLLDLAYHALRLDPKDQEDCSSFGEFHPFFLRSRARLLRDDIKYDLDSWSKKTAKLRLRPARTIRFHPAPAYHSGAADVLANVDGLLSIQEVFSTSSAAAPDTPAIHKLLSMGLKRGLPLVTWRIAPPEKGDWKKFEKKMKNVFKKCKRIGEVPLQLMAERKSQPWARETVLLWDDDDTAALFARLTEEPQQQ